MTKAVGMAEISVETIAAAGVVGAGGAGFPTHVKLAAKADTVLINAAECEPLLHKDKEVLREHADAVVAGLAAGMRLTGAQRGIVGIKYKYDDIIALLKPKLASNMSIFPLPDTYPAGDEFILVYLATGRVIPPGGIPPAVGAVVMNVETAVNVAVSPRTPVTEKFLSVAGAVAEPMTLRVPVGVPLSACVAAAGGATVEHPCYIVGGVMMGRLENDYDAPVDKTTGAVLVFPADHIVVRRYRQTYDQLARIGRSACDQCTFCTELCPRYLLGHPIEPHRTMRSLMFNLVGEPNVAGTSYCCECNLCSLYSCPEDLDPKNVCARNKRERLERGIKWDKPPFNPARPGLLLGNRQAPTRRLFDKLGLTQFRNVGPMRPGLLPADRVAIRLKQHAGAPAEAKVAVGQKVRVGDLLAAPPVKDGKPALGARVHASIDGTVAKIDGGIIRVEKT